MTDEQKKALEQLVLAERAEKILKHESEMAYCRSAGLSGDAYRASMARSKAISVLAGEMYDRYEQAVNDVLKAFKVDPWTFQETGHEKGCQGFCRGCR